MRPPIRLAALMGLHVVHVFTHDSLALGEDGPTHQPIEQLASLRAIPKLTLIRPGDANETAVAWKVAIETRDRPVLLALTPPGRADARSQPLRERRRRAPRRLRAERCARTAAPALILIASGSEVGPDRRRRRAARAAKASPCAASRCRAGICSSSSRRAIATRCCRRAVTARLAVELGVAQGWDRYVGERGDMLGIDRFGASAPADVLLEKYGFTVDNVVARAKRLLAARPAEGTAPS